MTFVPSSEDGKMKYWDWKDIGKLKVIRYTTKKELSRLAITEL